MVRSIQTLVQATLTCCALCGSHGTAAPSFTEQAIFTSGQGGYSTYRIPAVIRTTSGALLAFCEGRKTSSSDAGDIDIVMRRSTDHGTTWEPMQLVTEEGDNAATAIGNPVPVVDESTGHIFLIFCRNNSRVFCTSSADDGVSWSPRVEITTTCKLSTWGWYATGPGSGFQVKRGAQAGRLVVPSDHQTTGGTYGDHVIYSDDHGATWQIGAVQDAAGGVNPNENEAVELIPPAATGGSRIYFNSRDQGGAAAGTRAEAWSQDGGTTYVSPFANNTGFVCPVVQGSLLRFRSTDEGDATNRILFACPNGSSRARLSVWSSADEAASWSAPKLVCEGPSAYSDMVRLTDGRTALLYEKGVSSAYETITLARFNEEWLDAPEPPAENPGAAFWTFDETAAGGVCSTTAGALLDLHPQANNLHFSATKAFPILAGAAAFDSGGALSFAADGGARISDSDSQNRFDYGPNDSFTVEVVCRIPNGSTQVGALVAKDLASLSPSWWLRVESGKARFLVSDTAVEPNLSSSVFINTGQWVHVAAVRDATNPAAKQLRVYVNGTLAGTASDTTTGSLANAQSLWVGRFNSGSRLLTGAVDMVRITPAALAPAAFLATHDAFDADRDAIPDAFERSLTGNTAAIGFGDTDGDGRLDLLEYVMASDPFTKGISAVTLGSPSTNTIELRTRQRDLPSWLALELQSSTDLSQWQSQSATTTLSPAESAISNRIDTVDLGNTPSNRAFFRYRVINNR